MTEAFTFHNDPGHGWLEVTMKDANALGLHCYSFSRFSYVKGTTLYLEEDCDASKFLAAYKAKHGAFPTITEKHVNHSSPIRSFSRLGE